MTDSEPDWRGAEPKQSTNGRPHFAYYDEETDLSFVWAGDFDEAIEISEGGYGEPVMHRINITDSIFALLDGKSDTGGLVDVLQMFQCVCDSFLSLAKEHDIFNMKPGDKAWHEIARP